MKGTLLEDEEDSAVIVRGVEWTRRSVQSSILWVPRNDFDRSYIIEFIAEGSIIEYIT